MEPIDGLETVSVVVWDFDGVLNIAGETWKSELTAQTGLDADALVNAVFGKNRRALLTGEDDILDRLEGWLAETSPDVGAEDVLEILLEHDNNPDRDLLRLITQLDKAGVGQVIGTNSDARRARFLVVEGDWVDRVDAVFASGELGAMKPDAAFFQAIEDALALPPAALLLIDDTEANVDAADRKGWRTWHYKKNGAFALAQALMPLLLRNTSE